MIIFKLFIFIEFILFLPFIFLQIILFFKSENTRYLKKLRTFFFKKAITFNEFLFRKIRLLFLETYHSIFNPNINKFNFNDFKNSVFLLSPDDFEKFAGQLYSGLGFSVKVMPPGPDGGKDVILTKGNEKFYVECKHYTSNISVGREICQKLVGAAIVDGVYNGIIFTCGTIHNNAYVYANKLLNSNFNLVLVDLEEMYNLYLKTNLSNKKLLLSSEAFSGNSPITFN